MSSYPSLTSSIPLTWAHGDEVSAPRIYVLGSSYRRSSVEPRHSANCIISQHPEYSYCRIRFVSNMDAPLSRVHGDDPRHLANHVCRYFVRGFPDQSPSSRSRSVMLFLFNLALALLTLAFRLWYGRCLRYGRWFLLVLGLAFCIHGVSHPYQEVLQEVLK